MYVEWNWLKTSTILVVNIGYTFRLEPENIVDYHEWNENEWKNNDFNHNIPEKDKKKRKVTKIALSHEDEVSIC